MLEVNLSSFFGNSGKGLISKVKILEKLENSFWKVRTPSGIKTVFSGEKLEPGKTVKALIKQERNILKLELADQEVRKGSPDFFYSDPVSQTDILLKTASKLKINLSESNLYLLKKILKKKKTGKFMIPLLLDALEKNFRTEIQLSALSGSFDRGSRENSSGRENLKKYIKKKVSEAEDSNNPLFLFNHLKSRKDHWIVIPFNITGKNDIDGAVRLRISGEKVINIALDAVKGGIDEWAFYITPEKSNFLMKVYCREPEKLKESESFVKFAKKLQNLRVKIDDNVKDIASYNGFDDKIAGLDVMA